MRLWNYSVYTFDYNSIRIPYNYDKINEVNNA